MTSMFSTIMKSSLFNYAKRLAITCVFLSFAVVATASSNSYYAQLNVNEYGDTQLATFPTGKGKVYVYEGYGKVTTNEVFMPDQSQQMFEKFVKATYDGINTFEIAAHPIGTNSFIVGWYNEDGTEKSISTSPSEEDKEMASVSTNNASVDEGSTNVQRWNYYLSSSSTNLNDPVTHTIQAHFGRKVHIMSYNGEKDEWVDNISTSDPDRYAYSANINSPQFSLLYNLVLHTRFNDKTITLEQNDDSPFNLSLEAGPNDAEGRKTWRLTVTPKGVAESYEDNVVFQIDGEDVVTLALNLSRKPITVTLNPAEDLTGTYKYTQKNRKIFQSSQN